MKRLKILLKQPAFHAFLFGLCLILFSYPLLVMSNMGLPGRVYLSLFLPWAAIIMLLFLTTRSYTVSHSDQDGDQVEDGDVTHA